MPIEEHGDWYIQRRTISHPVGGEVEFFDVGSVLMVQGVKRYAPSSEVGFATLDEARAFVQSKSR